MEIHLLGAPRVVRQGRCSRPREATRCGACSPTSCCATRPPPGPTCRPAVPGRRRPARRAALDAVDAAPDARWRRNGRGRPGAPGVGGSTVRRRADRADGRPGRVRLRSRPAPGPRPRPARRPGLPGLSGLRDLARGGAAPDPRCGGVPAARRGARPAGQGRRRGQCGPRRPPRRARPVRGELPRPARPVPRGRRPRIRGRPPGCVVPRAVPHRPRRGTGPALDVALAATTASPTDARPAAGPASARWWRRERRRSRPERWRRACSACDGPSRTRRRSVTVRRPRARARRSARRSCTRPGVATRRA